ncbi:electron transfer flavoprotein subunit beta [Flavimobilis marinus]|uniref:Electron transfer flavoprotein subunit beta n=1 Tax=Flavimobilis marinus TaxID=285351 RepID=A0A1I2HMV6_9MICO|nr:electron transfer flavoprotein subunit beta/FixA family protein [Flavimobilis marinus]GHG56905.1 electron transfer flavoprotein subunit beta [Flavimobilis marinus]SFF30773.1 electron transfer flavoprotein beta subunit [Flavimobilis marinus]
MRIVVCVKHVPNIHSDRAFADGRVVRGSADGSLNELDEHPLEEALRILEALDDDARAASEIVAVTMGPAEAVDALRRAFQLGAHTGVHVSDDALAGSDYFATARTLAAAVRRLEQDGPVDLVLAGMAALDGLGSVVPALLAAELGLPQLTNATSLTLADGAATVQREVDGVTEELRAPLPAVVSVTDHINRPRFPNIKLIMAARTKPVTTWTLADLGLEPDRVGVAAARAVVRSAEPRPEREPATVVTDDGTGDTGGRALADFIIDRGLI